jgi:alpha-tubulin suppressor-like RCC1 family protein
LDDEGFDPAIQLAVHEDSSFLLTAAGSIYSWGKNENNFLGRETKFDVK